MSQKLNVFLFETPAAFALLQSQCHEAWALFFGATLEDRPVYTPSDCFETYPFPDDWESSENLRVIGDRCYEYRASLLIERNEGLTATYNRFHDPEEADPRICRLRELHAEMDRIVLDAYGWTDLQPKREFFLENSDDSESGEGITIKRKRPWRYRWPDEVRDEVLARLLRFPDIPNNHSTVTGHTDIHS